MINNELTKSMENIDIKEISEIKNARKVASIVEKSLIFNEQQKRRGLKILTPKQMLQRLLINLAQVKAGNTSENLPSKILQFFKFFVSMNSIKLLKRMNIKFMNYENSKTSDPHRLLLNPLDKINLNRSDKYVDLSNLSIYYTWKNI